MVRPVLVSSMGQNSNMGWMHQTDAAKISELGGVSLQEVVNRIGGMCADCTYKLIVAANPGSRIFFNPPRIRISSTNPLMCISLGFKQPYASSHWSL